MRSSPNSFGRQPAVPSVQPPEIGETRCVRICALPYLKFAENSPRSEEHTSELQSQSNLVCRLLLEKKKGTWTRHFFPQHFRCALAECCFLSPAFCSAARSVFPRNGDPATAAFDSIHPHCRRYLSPV